MSNKPTTTKGSSGTGNFSFGSGRMFADNDDYASNGITFAILAIVFEPGRGYDGKDRWAITVKAADREAEILTLGSNPGRDEELRAAQAHLERDRTITNKRLRRSGNAYYFTDGDR
jgi:hypothetical protein